MEGSTAQDTPTVDLACPGCGAIFAVAMAAVLNGGPVTCPGCGLSATGGPGAGEALARLRRGYRQACARELAAGRAYRRTVTIERSCADFTPN